LRSRRTRRTALVAAAALTSVALLAACSSAPQAGEQQGTSTPAHTESSSVAASPAGDETTKIRMSVYRGSIWSMPLFIAQEKGFFTKNHLDAQLVPVPDGPSAIAALGSGSVDVLSMEPMVTLPAIQKGVKMKVISGAMSIPWQIVLSKDFDGPRTFPEAIQAMKGHKYGVIGLGTNSEVVSRAIFQRAGASLDDVTLAAVGNGPPAAAAILSGQVDAVITAPPIGALIEAEGGGDVVLNFSPDQDALPSDLGTRPDQAQWASDAFIDQHPEAVANFQKTMAEVTAWMKDPKNKADVTAFFSKTFDNEKLEPQIGAIVDRVVPKYTAAYTADDLKAWEEFDLQWGILKSPMDDIASLVVDGIPTE
jgi:NitT/TauT family transport system substrate-binding protein